MKTADIWKLEAKFRLAAFIDRWEELAEQIGNRTGDERAEMAEIADAIVPELIRVFDYRHPRHPTRNAALNSDREAPEAARPAPVAEPPPTEPEGCGLFCSDHYTPEEQIAMVTGEPVCDLVGAAQPVGGSERRVFEGNVDKFDSTRAGQGYIIDSGKEATTEEDWFDGFKGKRVRLTVEVLERSPQREGER